jgi:hypothetical protein
MIDIIPVYSYWQVYFPYGRKVHYLGTSRLDKGEGTDEAKRRIEKQYEEQITQIKENT